MTARPPHIPRQRGKRGPVWPQRQVGLGLERHPGDRYDVPVDYRCSQFTRRSIRSDRLAAEGVSQIYLTGKGDRSYFDIRSIYYYGFSTADVQSRFRSSTRCSTTTTRRISHWLGGRAQLQDQPHQPDPQPASFDADQPDARWARLVREQHPRPRESIRRTACCAENPAPLPASRPKTDWRRTAHHL